MKYYDNYSIVKWKFIAKMEEKWSEDRMIERKISKM